MEIIISFKCEAPLAGKLKREPTKNRMFNTKSELIRIVLELFFDDHIVRRAIHEGVKRKFVDLIDEELLRNDKGK